MKIKVKKTIEEEIDVQFPMYRKTFTHFAKCTEDRIICVFKYSVYTYGKTNEEIHNYLTKEESTKEEFEEALTNTINHILTIK
jgi:hypothetical protein